MEWILILLAVNFLGGYCLGVTSLYLWQKTNRLRRFMGEGFFTRAVCLIFWPLSLHLEYLKTKKSEYNDGCTFMDQATVIGRLNSDSYLGLMFIIGFFPKLLGMLSFGLGYLVFYLLRELPMAILRAWKFIVLWLEMLGSVLRPKSINGS